MRILSPSIHEAVIARHFARVAGGAAVPNPLLAALHDAMQGARVAAEMVASALGGAAAGGVPNGAARRAREALEPALRALALAAERARAEAARVDAATQGPQRPVDATDANDAAIRARLAAMGPAERAAALREARAGRNDAVLAAVLAAPGAQSGIAYEAEHAMLRHLWRREHHADALDRVERLGRAAEDAERAGRLLAAHTDNLAGHLGFCPL